MPEVITKDPDVLMKVLAGAPDTLCGAGQAQQTLTRCPPSRFCSTPAGEVCVYRVDEVLRTTQIEGNEIAAQVCQEDLRAQQRACAQGTHATAADTAGFVLFGALAVASVTRRWLRLRVGRGSRD